ncbi:MAG: phytanoyl-CoA dioxygenase family protein [Halioglobus sp.]|nr:phytanoyl-CoA dioxygenase family protein [Halioglobus sp.]
MSIDCRTRRHCDRKTLDRDDIFDSLIPQALSRNAELAARGQSYKSLPALTLNVDGRSITLSERAGALRINEGDASDSATASLDRDAVSDLVQDWTTTMGLAMNSRVKMTQGSFDHWIGWEPVLRALFDGRPVHEAGAITVTDRDGSDLDLGRSFKVDDNHDEISHFLNQAGFLHLRSVFTAAEMAAVAADLDAALARARPDDGASWWAGDSKGEQQAVRVLFFHEQSTVLSELLKDDRLAWLANITGDNLCGSTEGAGWLGAEGLIKPLDIKTGLSDLPWHKDCGQGRHSYYCNGLTVGISVTGADEHSGALGVVPGSHRANVQTAGKDTSLDLPAIKLVTQTGDLTVHCSDTLHRAHPPTERPRKVVYTGFRQPLMEGDTVEEVSIEKERAARARLTNVRDRIADAGTG